MPRIRNYQLLVFPNPREAAVRDALARLVDPGFALQPGIPLSQGGSGVATHVGLELEDIELLPGIYEKFRGVLGVLRRNPQSQQFNQTGPSGRINVNAALAAGGSGLRRKT